MLRFSIGREPDGMLVDRVWRKRPAIQSLPNTICSMLHRPARFYSSFVFADDINH
jgi:hypothetical protein